MSGAQKERSTRWYIKRKPTGKSFFRDGFPYFDNRDQWGGSFWSRTRKEATGFVDLAQARAVLRLLRKDDKHIGIVRVSAPSSGKRGGA